jgi:hypothetical protein
MSKDDDMVAYEDVDDVIEVAERLLMEDQGALSADEIAEIGGELDIPEEYIERAREQLAEQRQDEQRQAQRARQSRRRILRAAGISAALIVLVFGVWSYAAVSKLGPLHANVEAHRAEVANMQERKVDIEQQFADRPDSLEKDAQLVGSQNRLRVATKRYNEAAAAYNRQASTFPASMWTSVVGLPTHVSLD